MIVVLRDVRRELRVFSEERVLLGDLGRKDGGVIFLFWDCWLILGFEGKRSRDNR